MEASRVSYITADGSVSPAVIEQVRRHLFGGGVMPEGIRIFEFGSQELEALREESVDAPVRVGTSGSRWRLSGTDRWVPMVTWPKLAQVYGAHAHGLAYVVDHGGSFTLQVIHAGQVSPESIHMQRPAAGGQPRGDEEVAH